MAIQPGAKVYVDGIEVTLTTAATVTMTSASTSTGSAGSASGMTAKNLASSIQFDRIAMTLTGGLLVIFALFTAF